MSKNILFNVSFYSFECLEAFRISISISALTVFRKWPTGWIVVAQGDGVCVHVSVYTVHGLYVCMFNHA